MDNHTWEELKVETLDELDMECMNNLLMSPPKLVGIDTFQLPSGKIIRVDPKDTANVFSLNKVEENR